MSFVDSITIEALEDDPYLIYARLRREAPVAYVSAVNCWLVTRWNDVQIVTKELDLFTAQAPKSPVSVAFGKPAIIQCDGDDHKTLREGIAPYYLPGRVKTYIKTLVTPIAEEAIAKIEAAGKSDLMSDYFEPISVLSLARSFGLHDINTETLRNWFHGLALGAINFGNDPERARICQATIDDINVVLSPIFSRLKTRHDHSPLSHMLRSHMPEGETRSPEWVMPTVLVILLGGMQEPGHAAGTTLYALLSKSQHLETVRSDMDKWLPAAITEGIRWVAPIGTQIRTAIDDVVLSGVTIPAGETVSAVISSACHDEDRFSNPDQYDLHRKEGGHAAFGFGHHFCAGRWFAQAQVEIALRILL